jgi:hypothetical protein
MSRRSKGKIFIKMVIKTSKEWWRHEELAVGVISTAQHQVVAVHAQDAVREEAWKPIIRLSFLKDKLNH